MTEPANKFVYPDTPALALAQTIRSVKAGAAVGGVFNAICSLGVAAVAAAGTYLLGGAPQLGTALQATATVGGPMAGVFGTAIMGYAAWPRYIVWQDDHYYDWHTDTRSDLPLRYAFIAMAACAATSVAMSFGIAAVADRVSPPPASTPQAVHAAPVTAQPGKLPQNLPR